MLQEQLNQLCEFANWIRINLGKSANIEIDIWSHSSGNKESVEYRFWIDGLIHKSTGCLDDLINMIPKFKHYCELNRELMA